MDKLGKIDIEGIGPVLLVRSRKARHLNITVKPYEEIRVSVPVGVSTKKAEDIVLQKIDWIKKHQEKMKRAESEHENILNNSNEIDRAEARAELIGRLNELADKYGFTYGKVFIRNQKTRWASCSAKNNINLNIKLIRLPDELIDYVILHELAHTRVKNHSKAFWIGLDKFVGDPKKMHSRLKEYGLGFL